MAVPDRPKLYHICHVDRLPSIIASGGLLSDAAVVQAAAPGTVIGMNHIKRRRMTELQLSCHPGLYVGQCVPFYFCPRSIMLYLIHMRNADLAYKGGQGPIVHLEADLLATVAWAAGQGLRWAFTLSNAGAYYFEDRADLARLNEVDWESVGATDWRGHRKEGKQAEFLLEERFPWHLIERIGVLSKLIATQVAHTLPVGGHRPPVQLMADWYY
ncbi:hypothetical protein ABIC63_002955 [Pseudacidovorax sp. 1753]|uniref:type II toxin-antitoxin system toxin DNA ADP-ribosyl transferase DarT n=1 Tax=Pseudacidovorax sp. 1753 TaxID=3156419 RepID=UPI00339821BB